MPTEKEKRAREFFNKLPVDWRRHFQSPGLGWRVFNVEMPSDNPEICPQCKKFMGRNDDGNLECECGFLHIDLT